MQPVNLMGLKTNIIQEEDQMEFIFQDLEISEDKQIEKISFEDMVIKVGRVEQIGPKLLRSYLMVKN